jgi:hypothetical protein
MKVKDEDGVVYVLSRQAPYDGDAFLGVFTTMALAMSWCDRIDPPRSAAKKWAWHVGEIYAYRSISDYGSTYEVQAHNLNSPES